MGYDEELFLYDYEEQVLLRMVCVGWSAVGGMGKLSWWCRKGSRMMVDLVLFCENHLWVSPGFMSAALSAAPWAASL